MFVSEFVDERSGQFPEEFLDCLPQECPDCGSPTEMSEALTGLKCTNPRCASKVAQRLCALCANIGVKDLGQKRAEAFIRKHDVGNPLEIFAYSYDRHGELGDGVSADVSRKIEEQFRTRKRFTLSEYVRVANLPFIQTSCVSIFGDYDDLYEAYRDIEAGGVEFIRDKLAIKKGSKELGDTSQDISLRALRVFESLMTYKNDLFSVLKFVEIIKVNGGGDSGKDMLYLKAVCSDEVGYPFKTKNDFYATVNNSFKGAHVEFLASVTKGIDYLVWAGADGKGQARYTNKVKKVEGWNRDFEATGKGKHIPIVTASQFLSLLEGKMKEMGLDI